VPGPPTRTEKGLIRLPLLTLWTIQTEEAWEAAKRRGALVADARRVARTWRPAYSWMSTAMRSRLTPAPSQIAFPIGAWHKWSRSRVRPDLRASAHVARGVRAVRVEFVTDAAAVLFSDFDAWHFVLNGWYLPMNTADGERFDRWLRRRQVDKLGRVREPTIQRELERSWERIFKVTSRTASIQACLWKLPLTAVTTVTAFTGR